MSFFKKNKLTILIGVLLLLGVYAYFNLFGGDDEGVPVVTSSGGEEAPVSQDLLISLTTLNIITLNEAIFQNEIFLSLSDFGVQIPEEVVGRRNPFAPVGSQ